MQNDICKVNILPESISHERISTNKLIPQVIGLVIGSSLFILWEVPLSFRPSGIALSAKVEGCPSGCLNYKMIIR